MQNFDLRRFLTENKLTNASRLTESQDFISKLGGGLDSPIDEQDQLAPTTGGTVNTKEEDQAMLQSRNALPVIDLGDRNGWTGRMINLHKALTALASPDPKDKRIVTDLNNQGTYRQYSQVVSGPFHIIYAVDSSD